MKFYASQAHVAICQPRIILGGRLHVLLGIIRTLNEIGIVPDIVTSALQFDPSKLAAAYGPPIQVNFKFTYPRLTKIPQDLAILLFNAALNFHGQRYDLLINSSNSAIFLPKRKPVVHYVHFPRERRFAVGIPSLQGQELERSKLSIAKPLRSFLKAAYRLSKYHASHVLVCNSEFTRSSLLEVYRNLPPNNHVIYPPVDLSEALLPSEERRTSVISIGRFGPAKRQLEQLQLARQLPHVPFRILGFVTDSAYYAACVDYVEKNKITNVNFYPDVSHGEMNSLLKQSKYFLHTLINEPFGITAVQAIAAGCIPIVHDSGGQRETVPVDFLRYRELDDVLDILKHVESLDKKGVTALRSDLLEHVRRNFDASVFYSKMKDVLDSTLSSA